MKKKIANRSRPKNVIPKTYGYEHSFTVESDDKRESDKEDEIVYIPTMPPLEGDEKEVKEEKD